MPTITINFSGDPELSRKAHAILSGQAPDPGGAADELYQALADELMACVYEDFDALSSGRGGRRRGPWDKLKPTTVKAKGHDKILFASGRLADSLRPHSGSPDQRIEFGPGWVRVGTKVAYANFHQEGTESLPQRDFLPGEDDPLPDAWERRVNAVARRVIGQPSWWEKVALSPG